MILDYISCLIGRTYHYQISLYCPFVRCFMNIYLELLFNGAGAVLETLDSLIDLFKKFWSQFSSFLDAIASRDLGYESEIA